MGPKIRWCHTGRVWAQGCVQIANPAVEQQHRKEMPGMEFTVFSNEL